MTASERNDTQVHLYIASDAVADVEGLIGGFCGREDGVGTLVGTAGSFTGVVPDALEAERLMDRHWLIHRRDDPRSRQAAECSFFDAIADRYESEIDAARNRANFRLLMQCAGIGAGSRVLDFGCGPGLSLRADDGIQLIGCDISPEMRRRAQARGLLVIRPEHMGIVAGIIDAVIASYVLHLAVPADDWLAAAACVRVGGRLAANFHKGRGLEAADAALRRNGDFAALPSGCLEDGLHGAIRTWERIR